MHVRVGGGEGDVEPVLADLLELDGQHQRQRAQAEEGAEGQEEGLRLALAHLPAEPVEGGRGAGGERGEHGHRPLRCSEAAGVHVMISTLSYTRSMSDHIMEQYTWA